MRRRLAALRRLERAANFVPGVRCRFWAVLAAPLARLAGSPCEPDVFTIEEVFPGGEAPLFEVNPSVALPVLQRRFEAGNRCFLGRWDGQPAFHRWVLANRSGASLSARPYADMHVDLRLGPGVCYYWDAFTRPSLRGRGIAVYATLALSSLLHGEGYERFATLLSVGNRANLRAFEKIGVRPDAVLAHLQCLGRDIRTDGLLIS